MCAGFFIVFIYHSVDVLALEVASPFSCLIMFLLFLFSFAIVLPIILLSSKNQLIILFIFSVVFTFNFIDLCALLFPSFTWLDLFCSSLFSLLRWGLRFSYFWVGRFSTIDFSQQHFICVLWLLICCIFIFIQSRSF